jgi:hypothetical protein
MVKHGKNMNTDSLLHFLGYCLRFIPGICFYFLYFILFMLLIILLDLSTHFSTHFWEVMIISTVLLPQLILTICASFLSTTALLSVSSKVLSYFSHFCLFLSSTFPFSLLHISLLMVTSGASPSVKRIFRTDPFPNQPPKFVRVAVCILFYFFISIHFHFHFHSFPFPPASSHTVDYSSKICWNHNH